MGADSEESADVSPPVEGDSASIDEEPSATSLPQNIRYLEGMNDTELLYQCLLCGIKRKVKKSTKFPMLAPNFYKDFVLLCW